MPTREVVENNLKEAMRANDVLKKNVLRMVLAAIKLAEVEKGTKLDEAAINAIFQKEIKQRKETIADAEKINREDIINAARDEIHALEEYLPKQLTQDELKALVQSVIDDLKASSPADTGKVMKEVMVKVSGRAAGDQVSAMVRQLLQPK